MRDWWSNVLLKARAKGLIGPILTAAILVAIVIVALWHMSALRVA